MIVVHSFIAQTKFWWSLFLHLRTQGLEHPFPKFGKFGNRSVSHSVPKVMHVCQRLWSCICVEKTLYQINTLLLLIKLMNEFQIGFYGSRKNGPEIQSKLPHCANQWRITLDHHISHKPTKKIRWKSVTQPNFNRLGRIRHKNALLINFWISF